MGGGKRLWWFPFRTHVSHDGFATLHRDIDLPPTARRHQDGSLALASIDRTTPPLEAQSPRRSVSSAALRVYRSRRPLSRACPGRGLLSSYRPWSLWPGPPASFPRTRSRALRPRTDIYNPTGTDREDPVSPFGLRLAIPSLPSSPLRQTAYLSGKALRHERLQAAAGMVMCVCVAQHLVVYHW